MENDEESVIDELTPGVLAFLGGSLAGALDLRLGTGAGHTIVVFGMLRKAPADVVTLSKIEQYVAQNWPLDETPPTAQDILRKTWAKDYLMKNSEFLRNL